MKYRLLFAVTATMIAFPTVADSMPAIQVCAEESFQQNGMGFALREGKTNELILTSYSGEGGDLSIPESIGGMTVTAISDRVFAGNDTVMEVKLPDSIRYFGAEVFRDSSVTSVDIPRALRVIPGYTFNNCQQLESVTFHGDIAIIANTAFKKTNITVPEELYSRVTPASVETSDISCRFSSSDWNYTVNSSDGTVSVQINRYTGTGTSVTIPREMNSADVTGCDNGIFSGVSDLKRAAFPETVCELTVNFSGSQVEEVVLPKISCIPANSFAGCTCLNSIVFQGECTELEIGAGAFKGCTSLESLPMSADCQLVRIGNRAFEGSGLTSVKLNIPSQIGDYAFAECTSLKRAELTGANIGSRCFYSCPELEEVTLSGEAVLDELSFFSCPSLANLNLMDCVLTSDQSFRDCRALTELNGRPAFDSITGEFSPEGKKLIYEHFIGADDVGFINQFVCSQVRRIVSELITDDMNDVQKIIALHDWVCRNTRYTEGDAASRENHSDASLFMNEYTVCEGYARACNLLFHEAGLESWYVHSSDHAWNIVGAEGHYFHVDSTWDDGENISRSWLLLSDEEMRSAGGSHSQWAAYPPSSLHSFQSGDVPECSDTIGDSNGDSEVNVADMVVLQRYLLAAEEIPGKDWVLSDVCRDGRINVFDLIALRQKITGQ